MNSVASSPFYRGEIEAQREELICPQSASQGAVGAGRVTPSLRPAPGPPKAEVTKGGLHGSFPPAASRKRGEPLVISDIKKGSVAHR